MGHFPNNPVVPAAAILAALVAWAEGELGRKAVGVRSARFRRPLLPGVTWRVVLEEREADAAEITGMDQEKAAINLRLQMEPA